MPFSGGAKGWSEALRGNRKDMATLFWLMAGAALPGAYCFAISVMALWKPGAQARIEKFSAVFVSGFG